MKKRPRPFFRTATGCWYVEIDGMQRRLSRDRAEADAKYAEIAANLPFDGHADSAEIIFRYLLWVKRHRSPRTHEWYAYHAAKVIHVACGVPPEEFRPHVVEQCVADLTAPVGNGVIRTVKAAFAWACRQGMIERSPLDGLEQTRVSPRDDFVTMEQHKIILAAVHGPARDLIRMAWETGARVQELRGFRVEDYDAENGRLIIERKRAKVKTSDRVVYLTSEATEIVSRAISGRISGVLLLNSRGRPWTKDAIACLFRSIRKKTGISTHLGAYRKGFVTRALKNGVDPVTLANLLGHANTNMIASVYSKLHLDPRHMAEAAKKASGVVVDLVDPPAG